MKLFFALLGLLLVMPNAQEKFYWMIHFRNCDHAAETLTKLVDNLPVLKESEYIPHRDLEMWRRTMDGSLQTMDFALHTPVFPLRPTVFSLPTIDFSLRGMDSVLASPSLEDEIREQ